MIGKTIADVKTGDTAELSRRVEPEHVERFIEAVGDYNPIHSDPQFAAGTSFGEPIAPGVFTAGLISAVIGTTLPGPGAVYLSQTLKFLRPVKLGDTITARVQVAEVIADRNRIRLTTACVNQDGQEVLTGEAWVMPSRTPIRYQAPAPDTVAVGLLALQPLAWTAHLLDLWSRTGLALLSAATSATRR